ncbi:hypothetical protein EV182_003914, partial [Spiromyces aspiralis]
MSPPQTVHQGRSPQTTIAQPASGDGTTASSPSSTSGGAAEECQQPIVPHIRVVPHIVDVR